MSLYCGLISSSHSAGVSIPFRPSNRRSSRELDQDLYKARHLIEKLFPKRKKFMAIATRYDKTAGNFLAAFHLDAAVILLN